MTTALRAEERASPYLVAPLLTDQLDTFAGAPEGFKRLRELVLNLAVRGMLVPQEANDAAESELPKRMASGPTVVDPNGAVKSWSQPQARVDNDGQPFEVPNTWAWVRLGEVVEVLDSLRKPVTKVDRKPGPYPYYGASGIVDYVSDYLFDEDLVLVGEDGAKWGAGDQTAFAISGKTWVNNHAHVLRPNRTLLSDGYLVQALVALDLQPFITGTTVPKLNQAKLVSIEVPVPPLAEQSRIVAKVEELMALIAALEAKVGAGETARGRLLDTLLAALADSPDAAGTAEAWAQLAPHFDLLLQTPADVDRLQQTLLQLAVKGRLVPQDPNDEPAAELLKRIRAEKEQLVAEGKIKREKPLPAIDENALPFELPENWQWSRLGSIGDSFDYGTSQKATEIPQGVPVLRMGNVQAGTVTLTNLKYFEDSQGELPHLYLQPGDLLFNRTNSYELVGKTGIFKGEPQRYSFASYLIRIRANTHAIDPQYLNLYMNSLDCRLTQIEPHIVQQNGQANFNGTKLQAICVPLPPLPEQSRIVAAVASLTALCDRLRERLAARRELSAKLAAALTEGALS